MIEKWTGIKIKRLITDNRLGFVSFEFDVLILQK